MTKYAIIKLAGKQFRVQEGDEFIVDKLDLVEGEKLSCSEVVLLRNGDKIVIGDPLVKKASVELEALTQQKGKKLRVAKYKAKSRYRRVYGHRQHQTIVKVLTIN
ncbi:MAG: 50S ribosomal protein L21 [Microgenomates bacterium 39_6]|nr:MAG: 50S ribosomal protein L21 [Microgenomates bacterium 39_6]